MSTLVPPRYSFLNSVHCILLYWQGKASHAANTACLWAEDLKYFVISFHLHSHEELLLQHTEYINKRGARGPACLEAMLLGMND